MRTFTLHLMDARQHTPVTGVEVFVGRDASGSFAIRGGHERFLTALTYGIGQFRIAGGAWEYLAAPGGLLYVRGDSVELSTRRLFRDSDFERISATLDRELRQEEEALHVTRSSLKQIEDEMMQRLWRLGHG